MVRHAIRTTFYYLVPTIDTTTELEKIGKKTHAGHFLCCDYGSKINGFPRLMVEHFYVKIGDPSCSKLKKFLSYASSAIFRTYYQFVKIVLCTCSPR